MDCVAQPSYKVLILLLSTGVELRRPEAKCVCVFQLCSGHSVRLRGQHVKQATCDLPRQNNERFLHDIAVLCLCFCTLWIVCVRLAEVGVLAALLLAGCGYRGPETTAESCVVTGRQKQRVKKLSIPVFCSSSWSWYLKRWFSRSTVLLHSVCHLGLCFCAALRAYFYVDNTSGSFLFSAFSSLHFRSLCRMCHYCLQQIDKLINTATNVLQFFPSPPQGEVNWLTFILLLNWFYYFLYVKIIFLIFSKVSGV